MTTNKIRVLLRYGTQKLYLGLKCSVLNKDNSPDVAIYEVENQVADDTTFKW